MNAGPGSGIFIIFVGVPLCVIASIIILFWAIL
jgi:hypothetical protein